MGEVDKITERLQFLVKEKFSGNVSKFARAAEMPVRTMHPLVNGTRLPGAANAVKIAKAADVSLDWLLTGQKQSFLIEVEHPVNTEVLADVIAGVDIYLKEQGATLEPKKFGEVVSLLYDIIIEEEGKAVDQARIAQVLRVAM